MMNSVLGAMSCDMAIDMGTFNTRLHVRGRGVVSEVPSAVAVLHDKNGDRSILAVGEAAWDMIGRTPPDVRVIRPIRDGLIAEFDVAEALLRHQMLQVQGRRLWVGPRVAMCIPYGTTEVERRAVRESAEAAGAREVRLVEQPLAAAAGAGLPIGEPRGHMVIDVGAGTTQIAVISLGGVVYSRSLKVGGDQMDRDVIAHLEAHHGLQIGQHTANAIKCRIGTALPESNGRVLVAKGRDVDSGFPKAVEVAQVDVGAALQETVQLIVEAVIASMEHTPPDLAADIAETGIVLVGGAAQLHGLERVIGHATDMAVVVAEDPVSATVRGAAAALARPQLLSKAVG